MIYAQIIIKEINYEKSFKNLFPLGIRKFRQLESSNLMIRFLLKMGDASMTAALGILELMDEKSKGELLCGLVNLYCQEIQSALNTLLQNDDLGKNICIGDICIEQGTDGQLLFLARNIKVDYASLAKNHKVKQKIRDYAGKAVKKTIFGGINILQKAAADGAGMVAEVAAGVAPKEVEKKAVSVINQEENKSRLLEMAEQVLKERGLCVELADLVFVQEVFDTMWDGVIVDEAKEKKWELSAELEEGLLDAVTGYLKGILKE